MVFITLPPGTYRSYYKIRKQSTVAMSLETPVITTKSCSDHRMRFLNEFWYRGKKQLFLLYWGSLSWLSHRHKDHLRNEKWNGRVVCELVEINLCYAQDFSILIFWTLVFLFCAPCRMGLGYMILAPLTSKTSIHEFIVSWLSHLTVSRNDAPLKEH